MTFQVSHGHASRSKHSRTYNTWFSMRQRCTYLRHKAYQYYGGRGIKVCDEWQSFDTFLADMGERPEGMTLDRIDNDGNYEPSNCRWATWDIQHRHKNHNITWNGRTRNKTEWAKHLNIGKTTFGRRLKTWGMCERTFTPKP